MLFNTVKQLMIGMVKVYIGPIKHLGEILNELKSKCFLAWFLSTNDFYTLFTTIPHKSI